MSLPVNKEGFWKARLKEAEKHNVIHYSVYLTNHNDWKKIADAHKKILEPYKDKKVLDAGCGYGRSSEWFNDYIGVDLSPDLIEKAKELYPDGDFRVGRLEELPFKDNEFDLAFCVSVKAMVIGQLGEEKWIPIEKELKRVAKKVILLEYTNPEKYEEIDSK